MSEINIYNKNHKNKYIFLNIKTSSSKYNLDDTKLLLEKEFEKILNKKDDKIFKVTILNVELMIYIVSQFKGNREWEEFVRAICERKKIKILEFDHLNLNPFH